MNVGNSVRRAIDEFEAGELDSAVLHASNAVDGTARKAMGMAMRTTAIGSPSSYATIIGSWSRPWCPGSTLRRYVF